MPLRDFFTPLNQNSLSPKQGFYNSQFGALIDSYYSDFPDIVNGNYDLAIIGVMDDRNATDNEGCALAPDYVREKFYRLNTGSYTTRIVDLGNIKAGNKVSDTYVALKMVTTDLIKRNICPIIIGGGQDLTYAQYMAYEELEQKVDLVVVDSQFDLLETTDGTIETTSDAYLNKIFLHEPNYLFNFSNLGYQTYFVSQDSLKVMDVLFFDVHRLGDISGKISTTEPIVRNANMLSFDMSAIRFSDACGNANAGPNGLYGEEACQICRYAGMNDKLSSIGFYEFNPAFDTNGSTAMLLAQMIWCFTDGFYNRKKDLPLQPKSQYLTYRASIKDGSYELIFVKSKKTDRWWLQVPYPAADSKNERFHLVPCQYDDYQVAMTGEMPDLWWRTYRKLN